MSNVRNFHVVREKSESEVDFSKRIKKHKYTSFIRVFISVCAIAIIVVLLVMQYKNQIYTEMVTVAQTEKAYIENTMFTNQNGHIITYSKDGISCMNEKGEPLWNMTYEMQNPIVHISGNIVAVCDYNGHIVHIIDEKGKVSEVDTNLPIRNFAVSEDGIIAAILEDSGNSWVNLYDSLGDLIAEAKATMTKTGYPLSVTLSGEVMGVSYLYVDSDTMKSSVTFYNFGGVGENSSDHIVSSYDYANAIVPIVQFLDGQTFFAVADNRLMFFSGSKKPTGAADILLQENIQGVYYGGQYVGLVFYDTTGQCKYRIDVYNTQGNLIMSHQFDMDYKDIVIKNDQITIYNESQCSLININGKEKFTGKFDENIIYMAPTDSPRKFVVLKDATLDILEFK